MDRQIVYPGQIPLETDLLNTNRNTMIALGKLAGALLGTANNIVSGLSVVPTSPASLSVNVNAGEIYSLQNVDNTAYSSLPADTTDTVVKQGIQLQPSSLSCPAPTTAGFSVNYLIEATYQDSDAGSVVLPYYNASNPSMAYNGPNNSGVAQATSRQGKVVLQAKAGIAAATGTQTTPTVDAGYVALAVVTVANGQATITASNISAVVSTQVLTNSLLGMINANSPGRLLNIQAFTGSTTYTPTSGTRYLRGRMWGAGGGGTGGTSASPGVGGGGGGYIEFWIPLPTGSLAVSIGAGGAGGLVNGGNGGTGGNSSFGGLTAGGGGGGTGSNPGAGGSASGGYINVPGSTAQGVFIGLPAGNGGGAFGALGGVPRTASGSSGMNYGGGGSGGASSSISGGTTSAGGAGANGFLLLEEYA